MEIDMNTPVLHVDNIGWASSVKIDAPKYNKEEMSFTVECKVEDINKLRCAIMGIKREVNVNRYLHLLGTATSRRKARKYAKILRYKIIKFKR